jgi:putative (di)nucleoside polyphosphate hydrolase
MLKYRPCVVGVFVNKDGFVLVGRRKDHDAWQFPQGGVEAGESEEEALYREMQEEIGCNQFILLQKLDNLLSYDFSPTLNRPIAKEYKGQSQRWFLCQFRDYFGPKLDAAVDEEFVETKWILPEEAVKKVVDWKRNVYQQALSQFDLLR